MTAPFVVSGVGVLTPGEGAPENWFDHKRELGPRGYKYLPSASQYMLAATKRALADSGPGIEGVELERRAAAVGTNGAASRLHADMDRTVLDGDADDLSPALAPFFSINLFGSRLAIEHGLQAFNLTLTSPRVAGFEAMQHGLRSAMLGRASWLMAGAVEAPVDPAEPGADASETGAVAVVLEPEAAVTARGGRSYGRCRSWTSFLPPAQASPDRAADVLTAAQRAFGLAAGDPVVVHAVLDESPVGVAFDAALPASATRVAAGSGCLTPMVQLAAALTEPSGTRAGSLLVVAAAAQGNVACALITR